MFETQVCMVSDQAAPNLLPLLDDQLKPKELILLVTERMKEKANYLQNVIKPMGIKVTQQPIAPTGNFQQMQEQLETLIKDYPTGTIALNVTGGTKWMAITAQEVFRSYGQPVFYVEIETDRVLFVDSEKAPQHLTARIKLKNYLNAYGYDILSERTGASGLTTEQRDLCHYLVAYVEEWGGAIGQLNRLASEAEQKKTLSMPLSLVDKPDSHLDALLTQCAGSGILRYQKDSRQIHFTDEKSRFFANGGWLEEYINGRLNELKSEGILQDSSHLNLSIASPKSKNEIDVAFMARNRLHLIECKTRRLAGEHAGRAGTESLYKLDSLSDLGGLGTRSMLVSYRSLGTSDKQRAKDLRIKVVEGAQIKDIKGTLKTWIQGQP